MKGMSGGVDCTGLGEPGTSIRSGSSEFDCGTPLAATVPSSGGFWLPPLVPDLPDISCWNACVSSLVVLWTPTLPSVPISAV